MKGKKLNFILKLIVIVLIIAALFLLTRVDEGFQTQKVDLYFKLDKNVLSLVPNSSGINVTSAQNGKVTLSIPTTMPPLSGFNGMGWSQAGKWIQLPAARLDSLNNALAVQSTISGLKTLRLPKHSKPLLGTELKLPQKVSTITLLNLTTATFGLGTNAGDPAKGGAKILVELMF